MGLKKTDVNDDYTIGIIVMMNGEEDWRLCSSRMWKSDSNVRDEIYSG